MHQTGPLVTTLAASLALALLLGLAAARLRLPALVGYLLAGVLLGPATRGFVADIELTRELAEIGVMLLMFGVGLHFSLDDLAAVRRVAVPAALIQMAGATALGALLAVSWGWDPAPALTFGLALSIASTVVLLRALESRGLLVSANGRIAVGWLVVQDIVIVLALVLLPAFAAWSGSDSPAAGALATTALAATAKVALFVGLMMVVGRRLFPWLLWQVARTDSRELLTLAVVAVAVGFAYGSAAVFGVSFALGAFFAGVVLSESDLSHRAAEESLPLREAFAVLFFVSVGMLFDPRVLLEEPARVLSVLAIVMLANPLLAAALLVGLRYPLNTALTVAAGLAQIGEFSFILAGIGVGLGLLTPAAQSLILAGAIVSIAANPLVFRSVAPAQTWIKARSSLARLMERPDDPLAELPDTISPERLRDHVVIVGFGRVGRRIGEALDARRLAYVVVEQTRDIVEAQRARGKIAVCGDASDPAVMAEAHLEQARMLVIATPDTLRALAMIDHALAVNPHLETVVRTHSEDEAEALERSRAGRVFMGEHELALAMTAYVMARASASPSVD